MRKSRGRECFSPRVVKLRHYHGARIIDGRGAVDWVFLDCCALTFSLRMNRMARYCGAILTAV